MHYCLDWRHEPYWHKAITILTPAILGPTAHQARLVWSILTVAASWALCLQSPIPINVDAWYMSLFIQNAKGFKAPLFSRFDDVKTLSQTLSARFRTQSPLTAPPKQDSLPLGCDRMEEDRMSHFSQANTRFAAFCHNCARICHCDWRQRRRDLP